MWLNDIYQHLSPIAFQVGPLAVRWYALAYIAGFICGGLCIYHIAKRWKLGITADDVMGVMIGIMFGVLVGARLFYCIFYGVGYYLEHPLEIFMTMQGGMSFHGGLVGAMVGGAIACRLLHISPATMCDLAVIGTPVGLFFGRVANFINGELWGKPTDLSWGVMFESGGNIYRHPSQLYEALLEGFVLFIILFSLAHIRSQEKRPPELAFTGLFLALYGIFRFLIEFVRLPDEQLGYLFGVITMGQILSIPLIVVGIGLIIFAYRRKKPHQAL